MDGGWTADDAELFTCTAASGATAPVAHLVPVSRVDTVAPDPEGRLQKGKDID